MIQSHPKIQIKQWQRFVLQLQRLISYLDLDMRKDGAFVSGSVRFGETGSGQVVLGKIYNQLKLCHWFLQVPCCYKGLVFNALNTS